MPIRYGLVTITNVENRIRGFQCEIDTIRPLLLLMNISDQLFVELI